MAKAVSASACKICAAILLAAGGHFLTADAATPDRVRLELRGRITPRCGLSEISGELNFDLRGGRPQSRNAALAFTIDCNTPFKYAVHAETGAMTLQAADAGDGKPRLPYGISITIPTDDGGTLRRACDGPDEACVVDSGDNIAIGKRGEIVVSLDEDRWAASAGIYGDRIQINLSAKE
jgi:hypothetical protein